MGERVAMSGILHLEIVTLDHALEALTFRSAGDIHYLTLFEKVYLKLGTQCDLGGIDPFGAKLPQTDAGFSLGLGEMTGH